MKVFYASSVPLLITLSTLFSPNCYAQDFLKDGFPTLDSSAIAVQADDLLREIKWEEIEIFCDTTEGQYTRIRQDEFLTTYRYIKQGYGSSIRISAFNNKVLEYSAQIDELLNVTYFDRAVWLEYVEKSGFSADPQWLFYEEEMSRYNNETLLAYYTLLGFNTRDEYGWLCEYAGTGRPPDKRRAVITLIKYDRREMLLSLLDHPNAQTNLYAADALIYLDIVGELESISLRENRIRRRSRRYYFKYSGKYKLTAGQWEKIYAIRDSGTTIVTCGNMGSYKQYRSSTDVLLSARAINEIYQHYSYLKLLGYFRV